MKYPLSLARNIGLAFLLVLLLNFPQHTTYGQNGSDNTIHPPLELERMSWSSDGSKLALATGISGCDPDQKHDHAVLILDASTLQIVNRFLGHSCRLIDVAWSPDGTKIVSTLSGGDYAFVWDSKTGDKLFKLPEHNNFTTSAAWSPDGSKIITGSLDRTAKIWDVTTQEETVTLHHPSQVHWVTWSPDSSKVATACSDNNVYIWDVLSGQMLTTLVGHTDDVEIVAWSPDGIRIASGSLDGTTRIWETVTSQTIQSIQSNLGPIMDIEWSPVGNKLAYIGNSSGAKGGLPEIIEPQEPILPTITPVLTPTTVAG